MRTLGMKSEGSTYTCRIVKSIAGEDLLIGYVRLLDLLHPGEFGSENNGFASKDAEDLYDNVFYFMESQNLPLSDKELC